MTRKPSSSFYGAQPVLESKDIAGVAKYLTSGRCRKVFFMLGAGISTSAGIPDFRSPETGLYANLARLDLPFPEAVFELNFFRRNPVPFYTLAQELYPGKFRPTISHSFVRLLAEHSLLHTCFTQNIDTLERRAGVPSDKIIEAHGSFATQRCINCHRPYDDEKMKTHVRLAEVPKCEHCKGLVKPDIVFFGESLPDEFINAIPLIGDADLLIIMGTSLTVHPFASLAGLAPSRCPRVLINIERVGDIGSRPNDVVLRGKCDDIVERLCKELGWFGELQKLWEGTKVKTGGRSASEERSKAERINKEEERVAKEMETITQNFNRNLALQDALDGIAAKQSQETAPPSSDVDPTNITTQEETTPSKSRASEEPGPETASSSQGQTPDVVVSKTPESAIESKEEHADKSKI